MFHAWTGQTEVNPEQIEKLMMQWLLEMKKAGKAPSTLNRYASTCRSWLEWSNSPGDLRSYRAPKVPPCKPQPIPEGKAGLSKLFKATPRSDIRALIALQGLVGLRVHEAIKVNVHDFDKLEKTLTILGKGGKTRVVPVSSRAWQIMLPAMAKSLSNSTSLVPLQERHARRMITLTGERAGLSRPIKSQDLRKTFATIVLKQCGDIYVVCSLLGHERVTTTQIYVTVEFDKMRQAVEF